MNNQTKKPPMGGIGPSKGPMSVEKAKDFKGTTKKLLKNYLSKYKIAIIKIFSLMICFPSYIQHKEEIIDTNMLPIKI